MKRGYFGIGIYHPKTEMNIGTLWRSAHILGASFVFTVGRRYRTQASDTTKAYRHIPMYHYTDMQQFSDNRPYDCPVVGIELSPAAIPIAKFAHPRSAIYMLGAEDHGLTGEAVAACQSLVVLPGDTCLNVAVAGSLVMFHRQQQLAATVRGVRCGRELVSA